MAQDAASSPDGYSRVWVVAGDDVLSSAIVASLMTIGWPDVRLLRRGERLGAVPWSGQRLHVVLVADGRGQLPDPSPVLVCGLARYHVVAVGTRQALVALATAVEQGAAALDADQPFGDLIRQLDRELACACWGRGTTFSAALRRREGEARRFTLLTCREQDVLCAMIRGESAAQMARAQQVSIATVRTHVRAILSKLGVPSQLAAVAMAHRSCRESVVIGEIHRVAFINSDDDPIHCRHQAGNEPTHRWTGAQ